MLVVREHKPDDSRMKKIQILSVILDNSLKRTDQLVPNFGTRTLSMYYEGLGAVFFMNAGHGYWEIHPLTTKQGAAEVETRERFREKLIEVVGDYGYTLRTLGPEDYMVVDVRFPAGWESNPGLVLKVRKKDVDAFSREEMDFEEFRRKVEILEFKSRPDAPAQGTLILLPARFPTSLPTRRSGARFPLRRQSRASAPA